MFPITQCLYYYELVQKSNRTALLNAAVVQLGFLVKLENTTYPWHW